MDTVELEMALDSMRKRCKLEYRGGGHYDVIRPGLLRDHKIANIDIFKTKVRISNLKEPLYGFQKDELIEEAVRDFMNRLA